MTKSHEQSLADRFNKFMSSQGSKLRRHFEAFSLDGDDRDTGGDYVMTDTDRFVIVEFKYVEAGILAEGVKERRLELCRKLSDNAEMRDLHDRCHYVAWGEVPGKLTRILTNVYRFEVCNGRVFGEACDWTIEQPPPRDSAGEFARKFFTQTQTRSLSKDEFETYIGWVKTETSGAEQAEIELVASQDDGDELYLLRFTSIQELYDWAQEAFPKAIPGDTHGGAGPSGGSSPPHPRMV
jgi:hypothetical protein